jgi:hypothetical protein
MCAPVGRAIEEGERSGQDRYTRVTLDQAVAIVTVHRIDGSCIGHRSMGSTDSAPVEEQLRRADRPGGLAMCVISEDA